MANPDGGWVPACPPRRLPPAWLQGLPAPPPAAHVSAARSRHHAAVPTLRLAGGGAAGGAAAAVAAAAAPAGTCMTSGRRRPRAACFWQARRRQTSRRTTPRVATTSQCASPPRGAVPAKSATQPVRRRHACVRLRCRVLLPCACQAGWTHVSIRACVWARLWAGWAGWCHAACCCHAGRPAAGRLPVSPQQLIPGCLACPVFLGACLRRSFHQVLIIAILRVPAAASKSHLLVSVNSGGGRGAGGQRVVVVSGAACLRGGLSAVAHACAALLPACSTLPSIWCCLYEVDLHLLLARRAVSTTAPRTGPKLLLDLSAC